jgi:hypothetical protein
LKKNKLSKITVFLIILIFALIFTTHQGLINQEVNGSPLYFELNEEYTHIIQIQAPRSTNLKTSVISNVSLIFHIQLIPFSANIESLQNETLLLYNSSLERDAIYNDYRGDFDSKIDQSGTIVITLSLKNENTTDENPVDLGIGTARVIYLAKSNLNDTYIKLIPIIVFLLISIFLVELAHLIRYKLVRTLEIDSIKPDSKLIRNNNIKNPTFFKTLSICWKYAPSGFFLGIYALVLIMFIQPTKLPANWGITSDEIMDQFSLLFNLVFILLNVSLLAFMMPLEYDEVSHLWTYPIPRKKLHLAHLLVYIFNYVFLHLSWLTVVIYYRYTVLLNITINWTYIIIFGCYILVISVFQLLVTFCVFFITKNRSTGISITSTALLLNEFISPKVNLFLSLESAKFHAFKSQNSQITILLLNLSVIIALIILITKLSDQNEAK